jgi:ligand-binding sensor domain-containing protein
LLAAAAAPDPPGAVVTSLTLFAGTPRGLWKSGDWGGTWERVRGRSQGDSIDDVGAARCILPMGPGVYVGTDAGLFFSEDFGQTWKQTDLRVPVHAILPSRYPQSDPTVFAGTADGLMRSLDAARTFAPTILRGVTVTRLEWPGPDLVLATTTGVAVSADGGRSFRSGRGLPDGPVEALALSSYYAVDPVLFAGTAKGVFRSTDGAQSWSAAGLEGRTVRDLAWLGPIVYAATDEGLYRSENAGHTWETLGEGLTGRQPRRLLFPLAPDSAAEAFLGTDRGVLHTVDGGLHWTGAGSLDDTVLVLSTFPPPAPVAKGRKRK